MLCSRSTLKYIVSSQLRHASLQPPVVEQLLFYQHLFPQIELNYYYITSKYIISYLFLKKKTFFYTAANNFTLTQVYNKSQNARKEAT